MKGGFDDRFQSIGVTKDWRREFEAAADTYTDIVSNQ